MKLKREEMIKQKLHATKTFQLKQLMTKNKFGEKLKQYFVPVITNQIREELWKINSYGILKKELLEWFNKKGND